MKVVCRQGAVRRSHQDIRSEIIRPTGFHRKVGMNVVDRVTRLNSDLNTECRLVTCGQKVHREQKTVELFAHGAQKRHNVDDNRRLTASLQLAEG